jgi:hypothetical protein
MESTREASLYAMLTAVEDASPVQAVEAVTRELGAALNARSVSFLIADQKVGGSSPFGRARDQGRDQQKRRLWP